MKRAGLETRDFHHVRSTLRLPQPIHRRAGLVADLRKEDFTVYEKLNVAKSAIGQLVFDLFEKDDEPFFVQFGFNARLTQEWTTDRKSIRHALEDVNHPTGDTTLYDAIALALPTAQEGRRIALSRCRSFDDAGALRQITDDTGGRTEVVRGANGLDAAVARIAEEWKYAAGG